MGVRGPIISKINQLPLGVFPILILGATAITGIVSQGELYRDYATIIVLLIGILVYIYSYWKAKEIKLVLIQVDPESKHPSRDHHYNEHYLEEGYIEFDVFVDIPEWMDNFILEFNVNSPLEVGLWQVPDDYNESNDKIKCSENAHDFGFILTVGGNADELGTADRELEIIEKKTGNCMSKITIKSENNQSATSYRDYYGAE